LKFLVSELSFLCSTIRYSAVFSDDPLLEPASKNFVVSPDHPLYPWPSKAVSFLHCTHLFNTSNSIKHFITSLLFSSPRLPFSEVQKKAVLNWAKELGVRSLPSLGAMKKCQSHLQDLVGDPTEKVTSHSGNTFYINNVAKAIAKVRGLDLCADAMLISFIGLC
jgi:hypothetical protein